jgi:hypothetical protein
MACESRDSHISAKTLWCSVPNGGRYLEASVLEPYRQIETFQSMKYFDSWTKAVASKRVMMFYN